MSAKKVKIKVKKKKINIKKVMLTILVLALIAFLVSYYAKLPVKNIYITGNKIVSDKEIIKASKLDREDPFIKTYFSKIKENLLKNDYIKDVKITRKLINKIYIEIEEYRPLAIYNDKLILSSKKMLDNSYDIDYVPIIINNIDDIYDDLVTGLAKVNDEVLLKISHIEYAPNSVDNERFLFYMVDANYIYITLSKIEKVNKYNIIVSELEGKKGIIYLDSGDYVEIKG